MLTITVSFIVLGNALQKSKMAASIVNMVVHIYMSLCLLVMGANNDNKIKVMARGYRNISTGTDSWIILFNPKFPIIKRQGSK